MINMSECKRTEVLLPLQIAFNEIIAWIYFWKIGLTFRGPLLSPPLPCGPSSPALPPLFFFMALSLSTLIIFPLQKPFQLPSERWRMASSGNKKTIHTHVRCTHAHRHSILSKNTHTWKQLVNTLKCRFLSHMGTLLASFAICEAFTGH